MICLSIETSTKTCSVALVKDNNTLGEVIINTEVTHSQKLLPSVDMLLNLAEITLQDIDLIGVAVGPGSFTGLRIGIATAKGLAYGRKIPVMSVSTLEALAHTTGTTKGPQNCYIVPILNARRNQVYTGIFNPNKEYQQILEDSVIKLDELIEELKKLQGSFTFTGDGVPAFKERIVEQLGEQAQFMPNFNCLPRAAAVGQLAIQKFNQNGGQNPYEIKPEYLRLSEAERNLLKGCQNG